MVSSRQICKLFDVSTDVVCTIKALNEAQFELEHRQSSLLQSQQTWAERFDRFDVITADQQCFRDSNIPCQQFASGPGYLSGPNRSTVF